MDAIKKVIDAYRVFEYDDDGAVKMDVAIQAAAELEQLLAAARPFSVRPEIVLNINGRDFVPLDMAYVDALAAALKGTK